jgi:hypothetical protein
MLRVFLSGATRKSPPRKYQPVPRQRLPPMAYAHSAQILKSQPEDSLAWFGKGNAALAKSAGPSFNSQEAISCFNKALQFSTPDKRDKLKIDNPGGLIILRRLFARGTPGRVGFPPLTSWKYTRWWFIPINWCVLKS